MKKEDLEIKFVNYLSRKSKKDGSVYGEFYVKDKVARLRKLQQVLPVSTLINITDKNYFHITDKIMKEFSQTVGTTKGRYKYADYLVVLRLLYEMNNGGKQVKRYAYYAGVKVV
jgi:hypothetical protein